MWQLPWISNGPPLLFEMLVGDGKLSMRYENIDVMHGPEAPIFIEGYDHCSAFDKYAWNFNMIE